MYLVPSSSDPVASRPPLGIGLLRRPSGDSFRLGVSCAGLPRIGGLLADLLEVGLLRVPQILCLTPLPGVRSGRLFLA